jgi:hypothetical protein
LKTTLVHTNLQLLNASRCFSAESHFFWQAVRDCQLAFARVSTHEQRADVMTKGLVQAVFEKLRKKIMGW